MKPLLSLGSAGPVVKELQSLLNSLPTMLPRLTVDGLFGAKTRSRVVEFQGQRRLSQDGVVGPNTWQALFALIEQIGTAVVPAIPSPVEETGAGELIAKVALGQLQAYGNFQPPASLANPRIAGSLLADPVSRARQGGMQLAAIFSVAGHPAAQRCLTLSPQAEKMYAKGNYSAEERNNTDLPSWCGIFALYCCKMAGLKLSPWPLRWTPGKPKATDEFRLLSVQDEPKKGDIGIKLIVNGKVLNHHFVVTEVSGAQVASVDGNSGSHQFITSRSYSRQEIYQAKGGFIRPIWDRVLK